MPTQIYPPPPPPPSTPGLGSFALVLRGKSDSGHHHITKIAGATLYGFTTIPLHLATRILVDFNGLGIGDTGMISEYRRAFVRESAASFREVFVGGGVERPQLPCGMNGDMIAAMDELRDVAAAGELSEVHWRTYSDAVDRNIEEQSLVRDPDFDEVFVPLPITTEAKRMSAMSVSAENAARAICDLGNAIGNLIKRGWRK